MGKDSILLLGAHMSIAGKPYQAIERGESIGCTAIQIFTKSNRQWKAKDLSEEGVSQFKKYWKDSSIRSIVAHASYLLNIGSPDRNTEKKSIEALEIELKRCAALDIPYLVLHPGSHANSDIDECLKRISKNLDYVLEKVPHVNILLETMAGQGSQIGHTFEQLATIINESTHKRRIGICFDTCHAFAAGYDFRTEATYNQMWNEFDKKIGLHKLKVIHVNDSKKDLASRVDRHIAIGKGKLGLNAFELLFNDPRFFDIPKVLETPKEDISEDKKNMDVIKGLLKRKTCKFLHVNQ